MNPFLAPLVICALLLSGCSVRNGMAVWVKSEDSATFEREMEVFLRGIGFQDREDRELKGFSLELRTRTDPDSPDQLYAAYVLTEDTARHFYIGKWSNRSFTNEEKELIGECIDFLVARAGAIESGFVSRATSTRAARAKFHAAIKEFDAGSR